MKMSRFALLRTTVLIGILIVVAFKSAHQNEYTRNWNQTIDVTVFPINADGSEKTAQYISSLNSEHYSIINRWGEREAERYKLLLKKPFNVVKGENVAAIPPAFPSEANYISVLVWGLKFRYWAWRNTPNDNGGLTRVRMFVLYQTGTDGESLQHSLGLKKGLIGLVHAFSLETQTQQNNIVIAHELLHTVGAIDKYDAQGNPLLPHGLAQPQLSPRYPQKSAEIMAGRIPHSNRRSEMAASLRYVRINPYTAAEINWVK